MMLPELVMTWGRIGRRYLLLIVGLICLAAIPVWVIFGLPELIRIPDDFSSQIRVDSFDNLFDRQAGGYVGEKRSVTTFAYTARPQAEGRVLDIQNTFDVRTMAGDSIFHVARSYAVDPYTGQHVAGGDHPRGGYLFAPRMKGFVARAHDRDAFEYWHVNYDAPAYMEYRGTESVYGLSVYRYESNFSVDQTKELTGVLPGVGSDLGIVLDVTLQLWIDPYTGRVVQYADVAEAFYYDQASGSRLYPWNKFHNSTASLSVAQTASEVAIQRFFIVLFEYVVPGMLFVFGIVSFLVFFLFYKEGRRDQSPLVHGSIWVAPLLTALVILFACLALLLSISDILRQQRVADFHREIERVNFLIQERMDIYSSMLRGGRGLFEASDQVEREEWKKYVQSLDIENGYPGIQGLGFAQVVQTDDLELFTARMRAEGFPSFVVSPSGTRAIYAPVTYLEPFNARNQRAFGFDMFSEPIRREAMEYVRDSGKVGVSGKVILRQETDEEVQPGFLLYDPIFHSHHSVDSAENRRENIAGYVYAAFRAHDFMRGIFLRNPIQIGIKIYDGRSILNISDANLLYTNDVFSGASELSEIKTLPLYNRSWIIKYTAPPGFGTDPIRTATPYGIAIVGCLLASLGFFLVYSMNTRRIQALKIAHDMTKEMEKFQLAVDGVSDQIVITDVHGIVVYANPATTRITGFANNEIVGKKAGSRQLWGGNMDAQFYQTLWNRLLVERKPFVGQMVNKRKTGEMYEAAVTISPIVDRSGNVEFCVGIERDVTKEKQIDRAKTEFVSLASHQLRTPLSAIGWFTEMLLAGDAGKLTKEQKEYLDEIHVGNQRMIALVNALLNVSRLELGTFSVDPEKTDIIKIAQAEVKDLGPQIVQKRLMFTEAYGKIPKVMLDPKLTGIVIQNLLSNAVKYTPEGGSVDISLRVLAQGEVFGDRTMTEECIGCMVRDSGYGIPHAQQDKIFSKLFRADNVRLKDVEGTGLGLYIVKSIIDVSGGSVWFVSEEDKGTSFYVILPMIGMSKKSGSRKLT